MLSQDHVVKGPFKPEITVIGVGGAGGNAVNNMIASKLDGVNFMVCNTDAQALENSLSSNILQLGSVSTGGLGAGARPEIGRAAAEESMEQVMQNLENQNMVFITAGMGGGTGTGAAPVIAQACKERGILTVGVVTKPFQFEGAQRMRLAEEGIDEMAQYVDTLIVIPNQNLFRIANEKTTFSDAFRMADEVLQSGVKGVTDLMVVPGMINLDFADIRSATSEMGKAMMGTGEATGERRAVEAAEQAINNPLLDDVSMKGARSVLINVCGGHDMTLFEIEEASNRITEEVDPDATIIFGTSIDDSLEGSMRITVVATGIEDELNKRVATSSSRKQTQSFTQPRALNDQLDNNAVNTPAAPLADSFTTRYPEPSHVRNRVAAVPIQESTKHDVTGTTGTISASDEKPQQAAVATIETPQVHPEPNVQEIGVSGEEFVTDGTVMRKVEMASHHVQPNHNFMIPPFAPTRIEAAEQQTAQDMPVKAGQLQGYHNQTLQKKTPSLFERITGRNRQENALPAVTEEDSSSATGGSSTAMSSGLSATRKIATAYDAPVTAGQQGSFNIDGLAAQPKKQVNGASSDDLDIPAFLRRQIS